MIYKRIVEAMKQKGHVADLLHAIFFGVLSSVFGHVYLFIANYQHAVTDLREIPLLISVIYIRNPLYLIVTCFLCAFDLTSDVPYLPTVLMHILPVFFAWLSYQWLKDKGMSVWTKGLVSTLVIIAYYMIVLFPCFIGAYEIFGLNDGQSFFRYYGYLVSATKLEVPSTIMVVIVYMMQADVRKQLEYTNQNLEKIVKERTAQLIAVNVELNKLNQDLHSSNIEVHALNGNLENIVLERTAKINQQLKQLSGYAYMNSHEVRGPLARIMGLTALLQNETDPASRAEMIDKLVFSSNELDEIVRRMNSLLQDKDQA